MDMHVPVVAAQLGGRIADFPWSPRARGSRWLLIGLLVGLGLLLIALGWQAAPQVVPILLGAGALLLLIAVGTAYISFRRGTHPSQLTLYEQGCGGAAWPAGAARALRGDRYAVGTDHVAGWAGPTHAP